jgi:hypothetical protein
MIFELSDYLNTINQEYPQWYGWGRIDGDREVYSNLIVHSPDAIKPTEQECIDGVASLQADWDAQEYARLRQADYPSIQDCLHAILDDDLEALQVKRQEVKNRYPKP